MGEGKWPNWSWEPRPLPPFLPVIRPEHRLAQAGKHGRNRSSLLSGHRGATREIELVTGQGGSVRTRADGEQ